MKSILALSALAALSAIPALGQGWTTICDGTTGTCTPGTNWTTARGDYYRLPYDSVNHEFIYYGGNPTPPGETTIYSTALWGYSTSTHTMVKRVGNAPTVEGCPFTDGAPWTTFNPYPGHPQGYVFCSGSNCYNNYQVCRGHFVGFTSVYQLSTRTMQSEIPHSLYGGAGDGTFDASPVQAYNFQNMEWISGYGKAIYCCTDANLAVKVKEFDGATYTDVSGSVTGDPIPVPWSAPAVATDGTFLWIYGGCQGTSPNDGSGNPCNGTNLNDLYRYNPSTKVVTKMTATGGVKPPAANSSYPFFVWDSTRSRFIVYAGADDLWQGRVSGSVVTWTQFTAAGHGPTFTGVLQGGSNGNMAGYDPNTGIMVLMLSPNGNSNTPAIYELSLAGTGFSTTLTAQEALYPGGYAGANRTNEPLSMGVAIPDSAGITSINQLTMTGTSVGQFKQLGTWPSGNLKWVKASLVLPSLSAASTATFTVASGGSGAFGGPNLATDNGSTITISTNGGTCGTGSAICFTVKKAHFNGLDVVDIGSTHVVLTGASKGFVLYGPTPTASYPGNVTCSPAGGGTDCSVATGTLYSSANDASSTCTVEDNGPAMAILRCSWAYTDNASHAYMRDVARLYFYQGKQNIQIKAAAAHNADYGTNGTFATAYKGLQGVAFDIGLNLAGGNRTYTVGNHTGTATSGTMTGSDEVYLYQGIYTPMQYPDNTLWIPYTPDQGYKIKKNGSDLITPGTNVQAPKGWCDIADTGGVGVEVGVWFMAPFGSKGCDLLTGGSNVQIGILDVHNSIPYYLEWPQHDETTEMFVEFHASAISAANLDTEFQKFQAYLVARQPVADYNTAAVMPGTLITATAEDTAESAACAAASPAISSGNCWSVGNVTQSQDYGTVSGNWPLTVFRMFTWNLETDYWWDNMRTFLQRGWTGRWLQAKLRYLWQSGYILAWCDACTWRSHGPPGISGIIDGFGQPSPVTSANQSLGGSTGPHANWMQSDSGQHATWWGMMDYYFLTGDEFINEALKGPMEDWFLSQYSYQDGASSTNTINSDATGKILTFSGSAPPGWIGQVAVIGGDTAPGPLYGNIANTSGSTITLSNAITPNLSGANFRIFSAFSSTRGLAQQLVGATRFATWMDAVGEPGSIQPIIQAQNQFYMGMKSDVCANGFPTGCGTVAALGPYNSMGISHKRGFIWTGGGSGTWFAISNILRANSSFQSALAVEGALALADKLGPGWADYWTARDLAYGIARFSTTELFSNTGTWSSGGFRFGFAPDVANDGTDANYCSCYTVSTNGTTQVTRLSGRVINTTATQPTIGATNITVAFGGINIAIGQVVSGTGIAVGTTVTLVNGSFIGLSLGTTAVLNNTAVSFNSLDFTSLFPGSTVSGPPSSAPLFMINGTAYQIASVTDKDHLFLTTIAPSNPSQSAYSKEVDFAFPNINNNVMQHFSGLWKTTGNTSWTGLWNTNIQVSMGIAGPTNRDAMGHYETDSIAIINSPGSKTLNDLTISSFVDHSNGTYTLGWTTPISTDYLRIKWCGSQIVDWIGFDPGTNSFTGTASNCPWFGAVDASNTAPAVGAQTALVTTGTAGMSLNQFSVKAFAPATPCNISLSPTSPGPYTSTQSISFTATANLCGGGTLTWTSSGLPAGTSGCNGVNGTSCTVSGTLTTPTTYSPLISVSDGGANTANIQPNIVVNAVPAPATCGGDPSACPFGNTSTAYSQSLAATGGTLPLTWTQSAGTLPPGINLSSSGVLSGTPTTTSGSPFSFTALATDVNGKSGSRSFTFTINPPCFISTTTLPGGTVAVPYSQTVLSTFCHDATWTVSAGSLPPGLSGCNNVFGPSCVISGNPTTPGTYNFTLSFLGGITQPYTVGIFASGGPTTKGTNSAKTSVSGGTRH